MVVFQADLSPLFKLPSSRFCPFNRAHLLEMTGKTGFYGYTDNYMCLISENEIFVSGRNLSMLDFLETVFFRAIAICRHSLLWVVVFTSLASLSNASSPLPPTKLTTLDKLDGVVFYTGEDEIFSTEMNQLDLLNALQGVPWSQVESIESIPLRNRKTVWFKVDFSNTTNETLRQVLEYGFHRVTHLVFLGLTNGEISDYYTLGDQNTFYDRPVEHRFYRIPFAIKPGDEYTLYLGVNRSNQRLAVSRVSISPPELYMTSNDYQEWFEFFVFGTFMALAIYNAFLFVVTGMRSYIYFVLYLLTTNLFFFATKGYGFQFLWSDYPQIQGTLDQSLVVLVIGAQVLFAREFLKIKDFSPRYSAIMLAIVILSFISANIMVAAPDVIRIPVQIFWYSLRYPIFLFVIYLAYLAWRRNLPGGQLFLVALTIEFLVDIYVGYELVSQGQYSPYYYEAILLFTSILVSVALGLRIYGMRLQREIALASSEAKGEFLAKMSHEIRTPMNGILGVNELLSETELSQSQKNYTNIIQKSGHTLLSIINDILDFSKIDAGKMELEKIPFSLQELGEDCLALFQFKAEQKSVDMIGDFDNFSQNYVGDPSRIKQIINNLLGNALKFTDKGYIALHIKHHGKDAIEFIVQDTGIGLTAEQQEGLFESFQQADSSISRKYGGTGLGLTISKQLVELMNGSISVESQFQKGTKFRVRIPLLALDTKVIQHRYLKVLTGQTLVLASTNLYYSDAIQQGLRRMGVDLKTFKREDQLLQHIIGRGENLPNYILLDSYLVNWDVEKILRHIDDHEHCQLIRLSPIGQLTKEAGSSDDEKILTIDRPATANQMAKSIANLIEQAVIQRDPGKAKVKATADSGIPSMKILLAEDNDVNQMVVRTMLENKGHQVTIAKNGRVAIDLYQDNYSSFDLILMDCDMPEVDGFMATESIREFETMKQLQRITIIALTAHALPKYDEKCAEAGMDGYLTKPVSIDTLNQCLIENFKGTRTAQAL